ncbi:MFS transporter [Kribbella sancticallisti]|uniref:MFS transporter n=1 Tax=Kribbella sancticallisti TaxID=460087 RepID=A0ABN2E0H3_9ACTN
MTQVLGQAESTDARGWAAAAVMAATVFSVVTAEMLPVGLLTPMSADLGVSEGTTGLSLTVTGLVAAVSAPVLPRVLGLLDRRIVLVGLMLLLAVANLVAAVAPGFSVLVVARVLTGVSMGGVWLLTVGLAPRLVPARSVGPATSLIFSGIAVASVLGVPAGTYAGELAGWRWAFASLGLFALALAGLLALLLPPLPAAPPARLAAVLRHRQVRRGLLLVALLVTAHFASYTYIRPVLEELAGAGPTLISTLLLAYGVAGVLGNFVAGAAKSVRRMLGMISAVLAIAVLLLPHLGKTALGALFLLVIWGFFYGGVTVTTQAWQLAAAPRAAEASSALLVGVFNAAIALGAFAGGQVVDNLGTTTVTWLTGVLALGALVVVLTNGSQRR